MTILARLSSEWQCFENTWYLSKYDARLLRRRHARNRIVFGENFAFSYIPFQNTTICVIVGLEWSFWTFRKGKCMYFANIMKGMLFEQKGKDT